MVYNMNKLINNYSYNLHNFKYIIYNMNKLIYNYSYLL